MIDYTAILIRRYVGKQWTLNGDTFDGLTWLSDDKAPTQVELDAQWSEVQAEMKAEADAKIAARNSALTKLGLTADEVAALFG